MKGDFSRFGFNKKKNYTGVLKQQGRVDLDADWNEQLSIQGFLRETELKDTVGLCGVPKISPKTSRSFGVGNVNVLTTNFYGIHFIDLQQGWVVGKEGTILHTEDGGRTWVQQTSGLSNNLTGLHFIDKDHGWVVGYGGTILYTEDGGNSWQPQTSPVTETLFQQLHFADKDHGWIVGGNGMILYTKDGGDKWEVQESNVSNNLIGVHFVDKNHGCIVGNPKMILYTDNGGNNWKELTSPVAEALWGVYFIDKDHGWVAGRNGTILCTEDGGESWMPQTSPVAEGLWGVFFVDKDHGWITGDNGTILVTQDGGINWTEQTSDTTNFLNSIYFIDKNNGWVAGTKGDILITINGGISWERGSINFEIHSGTIYVDGITYQLHSDCTYLSQNDYPNPTAITPLITPRTDLIYLDIWQRHITAIEDPDIQEVALGQTDITTRLKTIGQVKVVADFTGCNDLPSQEHAGRLTSEFMPNSDDNTACSMAPKSGYSGLDNQLYRVEIHKGGTIDGPNSATFKWSRDNSAVAFAITDFIAGAPNKIKVNSLIRNQILALRPGDWVEILGDETELGGRSGTLTQIEKIDESDQILTFNDNIDLSVHSSEQHPKVRRWDQKNEEILTVKTDATLLEHGIQVKFSGNYFKTGDYWVFTARTATGDIEHLTDAPPMGIHHHYCPLALIIWTKTGGHWAATIEDCRTKFPPLTSVVDKTGDIMSGDLKIDATLHVTNYMTVGPFKATAGKGGIDVTGSLAEFGFVRRSLTSWPTNPVAGDRFVWYNPDGTARLWTHVNEDLLKVTKDGKVGIGIENFNSKLTVNGIIESTTGGFKFPDETVQITAAEGSHWTKDGNNIYYNNGNVGIGVSNPEHILQLNANAPVLRINSVQNSNEGSKIRFTESFNFRGSYLHYNAGINKFHIGMHDTDDTQLIKDEPVITINRDNLKVGIGTTDPRTELHILGRISSGLDFNSAGAMTFYPPDGFAWFHIDNGPTGGRATGRLRISHGENPGDNEIINILQNGNVGIGKPDPGYELEVQGDAAKSSGFWWTVTSDKRLKKNVKELKGALEKLTNLRGVTFEWKDPGKYGIKPGKKMGLIAQEIEKTMPEWVSEDAKGNKNLTLNGFEALIIQAFKELKTEIALLKETNIMFEQRIKQLET